jgi:predicted Rossmann-fold nucleotide-binding protein
MFEALTLIQTHKIESFPVVLMGVDYWTPMMDFIRNRLITEGTISAEDLSLLMVTDSPEEAIRHIATCGLPAAQEAEAQKPARMPALGEKTVAKRPGPATATPAAS